MPTAIHRKIRSAEAGELKQAILRLPSGWLVAGDTQPLEGYCILLREPVAEDFNALNDTQRSQYALDMGRVGDALKAELGAYRINYETWGNLDPALHTHIVPRFLSEDPNKRVQTPRQAYDWGGGRAFDFQRDRLWMDKVKTYLQKRVSS